MRFFQGVFSLLALTPLASAAVTYSIDFRNLTGAQAFDGTPLNSSTSSASINGGTNPINDPLLQITAGTITAGADPFAAAALTAANVRFTADLGAIGCASSPCGGLGVGATPALNANDVLVFTFTPGSQVASNTISVVLRGMGGNGSNKDKAIIYVDYSPTGSAFDAVSGILQPAGNNNTADLTFTFASIAAFNNTNTVVRFALVSQEGNFGFGQVGYTDSLGIPEPATWGTMLGGLSALVLWRRHRKA
jgi:hypothetical protein